MISDPSHIVAVQDGECRHPAIQSVSVMADIDALLSQAKQNTELFRMASVIVAARDRLMRRGGNDVPEALETLVQCFTIEARLKDYQPENSFICWYLQRFMAEFTQINDSEAVDCLLSIQKGIEAKSVDKNVCLKKNEKNSALRGSLALKQEFPAVDTLQTLHGALNPIPMQHELRRLLQRRSTGTLLWVVEAFRRWLSPSGSGCPIYWIKASVGIGKSVALARLIDGTERIVKDPLCAYFFCRSDDLRQLTSFDLLTTISYQLAAGNPAFQSSLVFSLVPHPSASKLANGSTDGSFPASNSVSATINSSNDIASHNEAGFTVQNMRESSLAKAIHTFLVDHCSKVTDHQIFLFIDDLDLLQDADEFILWILSITRLPSMSHVRVVFTTNLAFSHFSLQARYSIPSASILEIEPSNKYHKKDIEKFVRSQLSGIPVLQQASFVSSPTSTSFVDADCTSPTSVRLAGSPTGSIGSNYIDHLTAVILNRSRGIFTAADQLISVLQSVVAFDDDNDELDSEVEQTKYYAAKVAKLYAALNNNNYQVLEAHLSELNQRLAPGLLQASLNVVTVVFEPLDFVGFQDLMTRQGFDDSKVKQLKDANQNIFDFTSDGRIDLKDHIVRDHLLGSKSAFAVNPAESHKSIAASCLSNILSSRSTRLSVNGWQSINIASTLVYSSLHWHEHLAECPPSDELTSLVVRFMNESGFLIYLETLAILNRLVRAKEALERVVSYANMLQIVSSSILVPSSLLNSVKNYSFVLEQFGDIMVASPAEIFHSVLLFTPPSNDFYIKFAPNYLKNNYSVFGQSLQTKAAKRQANNVKKGSPLSPFNNNNVSGHRGNIQSFALTRVFADAGSGVPSNTIGEDDERSHANRSSVGHGSRSKCTIFMVTGGDDAIIKVWNTSTKDNVLTLVGHCGPILTLAMSPDNKYILSGSTDGTAILWNFETGEAIREYTGHAAGIYNVKFSDDGSKLGTLSFDGTACVWKTEGVFERAIDCQPSVESLQPFQRLRNFANVKGILTKVHPNGAVYIDENSVQHQHQNWNGKSLVYLPAALRQVVACITLPGLTTETIQIWIFHASGTMTVATIPNQYGLFDEEAPKASGVVDIVNVTPLNVDEAALSMQGSVRTVLPSDVSEGVASQCNSTQRTNWRRTVALQEDAVRRATLKALPAAPVSPEAVDMKATGDANADEEDDDDSISNDALMMSLNRMSTLATVAIPNNDEDAPLMRELTQISRNESVLSMYYNYQSVSCSNSGPLLCDYQHQRHSVYQRRPSTLDFGRKSYDTSSVYSVPLNDIRSSQSKMHIERPRTMMPTLNMSSYGVGRTDTRPTIASREKRLSTRPFEPVETVRDELRQTAKRNKHMSIDLSSLKHQQGEKLLIHRSNTIASQLSSCYDGKAHSEISLVSLGESATQAAILVVPVVNDNTGNNEVVESEGNSNERINSFQSHYVPIPTQIVEQQEYSPTVASEYNHSTDTSFGKSSSVSNFYPRLPSDIYPFADPYPQKPIKSLPKFPQDQQERPKSPYGSEDVPDNQNMACYSMDGRAFVPPRQVPQVYASMAPVDLNKSLNDSQSDKRERRRVDYRNIAVKQPADVPTNHGYPYPRSNGATNEMPMGQSSNTNHMYGRYDLKRQEEHAYEKPKSPFKKLMNKLFPWLRKSKKSKGLQ